MDLSVKPKDNAETLFVAFCSLPMLWQCSIVQFKDGRMEIQIKYSEQLMEVEMFVERQTELHRIILTPIFITP